MSATIAKFRHACTTAAALSAFGIAFGFSFLSFAGVVAAGLVLGIVQASLGRLTHAFLATTVLTALLVHSFGLVLGEYRINGVLVSGVFLSVMIAIAIASRKWAVSTMYGEHLVPYALLAGAMFVRMRGDDSASILTRLMSMGEDNGSFLGNIAMTIGNGHPILTPASGGDASSNGGIVLGILIALGASAYKLFVSSEHAYLDPARILLAMYDVMVLGIVALSMLITGTFCASKRYAVAPLLSIAMSGMISLAFAFGLLRYGHFTAVMLVFWLLCSVFVLIRFSHPASRFVAACAVLSASQVWQPAGIIGLAFIAAVVLLSLDQASFRSFRVSRGQVFKVSVLCLVCVVFLSDFIRFSISSKARDVVGYGGGNSVVDWRLAFALLVVVAIFSQREVSSWSKTLQSLIGALLAAAILIMMIGWILPPHDPKYGAQKLLYIVAFVATPLFVGIVSIALSSYFKTREFALHMVSSLAVAGIFLASINPISNISRLAREVEIPEWVNGVKAAFRNHPDRTIVCIDTRRGGNSVDAYTCSRLMMGMTGQHPPQGNWSNRTSGNTTFLRAPSLLTAANLCGVAPTDIQSMGSHEWSRISLVIGDAKRLSSNEDCQSRGWSGPSSEDDARWQIGWLTAIRWSQIPVYSYGGERVIPTLDYLRSEPDYSPEEINQLERSLDL